MKLLLDTHIWVWSLSEIERLDAKVKKAIADPKNELWLSPISVWELVRLLDEGHLELERSHSVTTWVESALARMPMTDAALSREVALETRAVKLPHHDPADRFLAATARVYDLTLVTADEHLLHGSGFRTMRNR